MQYGQWWRSGLYLTVCAGIVCLAAAPVTNRAADQPEQCDGAAAQPVPETGSASHRPAVPGRLKVHLRSRVETVHTNMCVLGRPFGIRQMVRLGFNVARDLTDAMYDPREPPFVSHTRGTEPVVEHIEKYWCPSLESEDLTRVISGSADPASELRGTTARPLPVR